MHANQGKFHNLLEIFFLKKKNSIGDVANCHVTFFWCGTVQHVISYWRGTMPHVRIVLVGPSWPAPHLPLPYFLFPSFLSFLPPTPSISPAPDFLSLSPATKDTPLVLRWHCSSGGLLSPANDHPIRLLIQAAYILYLYITVSIYCYLYFFKFFVVIVN